MADFSAMRTLCPPSAARFFFAEGREHIPHHKSRVPSDKYGKRLSETSTRTAACQPDTFALGCWAGVHLESLSGRPHVDCLRLTSTNRLGSTGKTASSSAIGFLPNRRREDAKTQPSCST